MSLFDIDKSSIDRGTPTPNSTDQLIDGSNKNHGTLSINPVSGATSTKGFISTKTQAVIANDGNNPKAMIGYQQGLGQWGLFVATDGVDVTTNIDLSKFLLNSNQDAFKIVGSGNLTVSSFGTTVSSGSVATGSSSASAAHGLGFIPAVLGFVVVGGSYYQTPYTGFGIATPPQWDATQYQLFVNGTNVQFQVTQFLSAISSGSGYTLNSATTTVKYYLLQETAN